MASHADAAGIARRPVSAYDEAGTPEEVTRRTFMVQATLVVGGLIGLGLAVPIVGSLVPEVGAGAGTWTPLDRNEWAKFQKSTDKAVQINLQFKNKDAYLPDQTLAESVWGIKTDVARFKADRPDLFGPSGTPDVAYNPINMGFVIFSPICPHLGCRYNYDASSNKFLCPCHGSQFDNQGRHLAGPAARGLDPLPLREHSGTAEVTWIRYAPTIPNRLVVSYTS